jgi:hypothetical protein
MTLRFQNRVGRSVLKPCSVTACLLASTLSGSAWASEGGNNNWANGSFGILAGENAPPKPNGTVVLFANSYRHVERVNDGVGDPAAFPKLPQIDLYATAILASHRWGDDVPWLGHAKIASLAVIPLIHIDAAATLPGPPIAGSGLPFSLVRRTDQNTGLGDLTVSPISLGWQKGRFHYSVGTDIVVPIGKYQAGRLTNPGFNYWTIRPVVGLSYFGRKGFEVSARTMYDFNFENAATKYRSGNAFHADFTVGQRFGLAVVGLNGFYFVQTQDDTVGGVPVVNSDRRGTGNRGRTLAVGPFVRYQFNNFGITAKYQREVETRYRGQGSNFSLNFDFLF